MIQLRRARPEDAAAVANVYLRSFHTALPTVHLAHSDDEVRGWIRDQVVPEMETWVATEDELVVGILVLRPGWIEQLYVDPDRLGEGIGSQLLDLAKSRAEAHLDLWTFQVNDRARRFYERNGFEAVELTDGAANDEREPDVRYRWHSLRTTRPGAT